MSTPANDPQKPFIPQDIDKWLLAAQEQYAKLHRQAAGAWHSDERSEVFVGMAELLLQAFEEMRIVSESLREGSQAARGQAVGLRARSHQLLARGKALTDRMEQFTPPLPQDVQQAESQMLEMFKADHRHEGA
jgi:hypothetical protein